MTISRVTVYEHDGVCPDCTEGVDEDGVECVCCQGTGFYACGHCGQECGDNSYELDGDGASGDIVCGDPDCVSSRIRFILNELRAAKRPKRTTFALRLVK